jgi:hypothetical protein
MDVSSRIRRPSPISSNARPMGVPMRNTVLLYSRHHSPDFSINVDRPAANPFYSLNSESLPWSVLTCPEVQWKILAPSK